MTESVVGFTGTRRGCTVVQRERLDGTLYMLWTDGFMTFGHGCCEGADREAAMLARHYGFQWTCWPGDASQLLWAVQNVLPDEIINDVRPYLDRNHEIVDRSDTLVATPGEMTEQQRSGTWATIRYARKLKRRIFLIFPNGELRVENP